MLIVLAGAGWLLLDCLNKKQLQEAEELPRAMADARAKFAAQVLADLNACRAEAGKARNDFVSRNRKAVPRKTGQFTIPQAALADEAARMQESANAARQAAYSTRMQDNFRFM